MDSFYTRTTSISSSLQVRLTMDSFYTRTTSISSSLWELRSLSDTSSAEHNNASGATITKSRSSLSPTLESTLQVDRKRCTCGHLGGHLRVGLRHTGVGTQAKDAPSANPESLVHQRRIILGVSGWPG